MIGGDLDTEMNVLVWAGTHSTRVTKRCDWMKHWLILQYKVYTALNTMYRKTFQKQTTFVSPKGKEKLIDYILTKRRYLRDTKDAEVNDVIHMGSDHRCVVATFHDHHAWKEHPLQEYNTLNSGSLSSKKR